MNKLEIEFSEAKKLWRIPEIKAFWIIFVLQCLVMGWTMGVYTLYILSNGLSLFQVTLLNTAFMLTDSLFNPYAGKLADKYGQKKIYVAGQVIWALGLFSYGVFHGFWGFLMAEITAGVGAALMSDALESWLRNNLPEDKVHKAMSHSGVLAAFGVIPAATLGAIIGSKFGFGWPFIIEGVTGMVAVVVSIKLLRKLPEVFTNGEVDGVWQGFKQNFGSKELKKIAIVTFAVALATQPFNMFWAPIFQERSGESWWLGSLWIGIMIMSSIGSFWAKKQNNGLGIVKMIMIIGIPMLFTPLTKSTWAIVGLFLLHESGRGAYRPIMFTFANRHFENKNRSTANSIMSSMRTVGSAVGLLLFGALTKLVSPVNTWGIAAVGLVILAIWVWKRRN